MPTQNYAHHQQYVPMYHFVLLGILALTFIGSLVNLYESLGDHQRQYSASLIAVLAFCVLMLAFFVRSFTVKVQDRAIRAEESLRCFALTGELPDPRLTMRQLIGLRFASDAEFVALARRAAGEGLSEDAIKRAIQNWRPDLYRA